MNIPLVRVLAGAFCALVCTAQAQVIELRATINRSQEVPATTSNATGSAIMLYDIGSNTFDLVVTINDMSNVATLSHIHQAAAGENGPALSNLGGEAVYARTGNTLRAMFRNVTWGGDKLRLIEGGAYYNIHSAQFPGGEVRGQMIPQPVRLVAVLDTAQEQAAFPAVNLSGVNNFGGAVIVYDPATKKISLRHSLFNYTSTFTNSHIHTGGVGISGGVNTQLGNNATAGAYNSDNGFIAGTHDSIDYGGDVLTLLAGGTYINYHSQAFPNGQLRGQIYVSEERTSTRFANLSVRGFVGAGDQVLIGGISITGTEPVRTLITAKGPSLAAFGVQGALANPRLALFDSAGRQIATNDNVGAVAAGSELARIPGVPTNAQESALVVVLPPGNYTAQVSAASGTGIALLEAYDLRVLPATTITASRETAPSRASALASVTKGAIELCAAPLAVAIASR